MIDLKLNDFLRLVTAACRVVVDKDRNPKEEKNSIAGVAAWPSRVFFVRHVYINVTCADSRFFPFHLPLDIKYHQIESLITENNYTSYKQQQQS